MAYHDTLSEYKRIKLGYGEEQILKLLEDNNCKMHTKEILSKMMEIYEVPDNTVYERLKRLRIKGFVRIDSKKYYHLLLTADKTPTLRENEGINPLTEHEEKLLDFLSHKKVTALNDALKKSSNMEESKYDDLVYKLSLIPSDDKLEMIFRMLIEKYFKPNEINDYLDIFGINYSDKQRILDLLDEYYENQHLKDDNTDITDKSINSNDNSNLSNNL